MTARPIRRNAQTPDRNGKIFYTSTTSLSHISKIYRDEAAGIWKIEYQIMYGYQGFEYVYLNDDGITVMVSGAGSKVEEWQAEYPGP